MSRTNREIVNRWYEEVWNQQRDDAIDQLLASDAVGYMEGVVVNGPADFKAARNGLLELFPDLQVELEATVAEGENIVVRWRATATHKGSGFGLQPTNRKVVFKGMTWLEIRNGKIEKGWDAWNQGALLETLRTAATGQ